MLMSDNNLNAIIDYINPLQLALRNHQVYHALTSQQRISHFMSYHVYCVWDFMNLLKTLQASLTCTTVPWVPPSNPKTARLINDIVLEEESDIIDEHETSHFAYYVKAFQTFQPNNSTLTRFLADLHNQLDYKTLITQPYIPKDVQQFLNFSYTSIQTSLLHTAAAFTFGREALVPDLFEPIINQPNIKSNTTLMAFRAYLQRHIELDGEHHSQLAYNMVSELCITEDDWAIVKNHAYATLKARLALWDAIEQSIPN